MRYLASGRYSDCFRIHVGQGADVVLKVSFYREGCLRAIGRAMRDGNYSKAKRILQSDAVSISNRLAPILNLILHRDITPHLVWNYGNFDCKGFAQTALRTRLAPPVRKRLRQLNEEGGRLQSLYTNVSFHERFTADITDFLHEKHVTAYCLKCMIMQVIYTVGCLQFVMPGFRHNDLSTNNVFVKHSESPEDQPVYDEYRLGPAKLFTGIPTILVALADWDFAHCQDPVSWGDREVYLRNERVVGGAYQLKPSPNPTYDVHFFLTTLLEQIRSKPRAYGEVVTFLRAVCGRWSDRTDVLLPRLEPTRILMHSFFDELRAPPEGQLRNVYAACN